MGGYGELTIPMGAALLGSRLRLLGAGIAELQEVKGGLEPWDLSVG